MFNYLNRLDFIWKCNKGGRLKSRSDCSINWGKWISKLLLSVWNAYMSLWYMFGSNGIGDGLKNGITKSNVINCLCVLCWERVEVLLNHYWCNFMFVWLWTVRCYENNHLLIFFVWTCHLHYSETLVVTSVMCIEKEWVLKRMYHFEGRIARRDGYYISRDVSRVAKDTIFRGTYRALRWLL